MIDILTPQIERARISRLRAEGVATFRDMHPKVEELPVACQTLLRHSIKREVAEHIVIDSHPYNEPITKKSAGKWMGPRISNGHGVLGNMSQK